MPHTYVTELIHCVFSTKDRRNLITAEAQPDLWAFIGGIARKNGFKALIAGGTENHVHILLSLPATLSLAKAMQLIKGSSSHWMNEKCKSKFAWQEGYGAFTLGISQKADTIAYIKNQAEHHRKRNFEDEFLAFLRKACLGIISGIPPGCGSMSSNRPGVETPGYFQASSGRNQGPTLAAPQPRLPHLSRFSKGGRVEPSRSKNFHRPL